MRTYRPFSKIIAPKRTSFLTIGSKLFLLLILMYAQIGNGQSINISNFSMPDTVYQNSGANVQFTIQNTSASLNILGNLKLNFRNETLNNQTEPLGGFSAIQFIAPLQTRTFNTIIPITPQYFLEGGNTVVIWPSFVGQPIAADDSIRFNIFVENFIGFNSVPGNSSLIIQNPVGNKLKIHTMGKAKLPKQICIRDLQGKSLMNIDHYASEDIEMSGIAPGIYFVEMLFEDGRSITQRIIRSDN
jgi:hypothetical protein